MTARELRKREATYRTASRRYEQAREARNQAVSDAIAEGWTHAQIAAATGLTRSRVGQLAMA
jgi:DNA-binding NarL/FixJ family response regulator